MSRLSLVGCAAILLLLAYRGLTLDSAPEDFQSSVRPSGDTKADGTIEVQRGDLEETVVATGTIEPLARVEVRSEVSGIVRAVLAEEGDRVARGQPIVELNGERLAEVVAERRAALARVRAYARVDVVGRAAVAEADARRRAARVERLARDGLVTAVELEGARREVRVAGISLRDAEAEQAARAAAVAQTVEGLRRAESDLARAVIRSPIDGVVLHRPVEVGTGVAGFFRPFGSPFSIRESTSEWADRGVPGRCRFWCRLPI